MRFRLLDVPFELHGPPDLVAAASALALPLVEERGDGPAEAFELSTTGNGYRFDFGDQHRLADDVPRLMELLADELTIAASAASGAFLLIHAAVVGLEGGAWVFPGPSGSGKTTLARTAVAAGMSLFSDEYALIGLDGQLHPFPRPLKVRAGGGWELIEPSTLGEVAPGPAPLAAVIDTRFQPGQRWRPERVSAGDAVLALLANAFHGRRADRSLPVLRRAVAGARCYRGPRGEAAEVIEQLVAELGSG